MAQTCEALVTKAELKKELALYPTEQAVTGIVALGLLETNRQIAKKVDATELGKRIIDVERKIADPIAKANAAAKAAEEARKKAISAAEIAGQAADATRSQGSKLGSALSRIISIATTLGTIYALLENMVDRERFAALENSFNFFQQVYDAQTASIQRIINEQKIRIQNAEVKAEEAQGRSWGAINTVNALSEKFESLEFDTTARLNEFEKQITRELGKFKTYETEIRQLQRSLNDKAAQADLKALETRINTVNSGFNSKNYDPEIKRLEDGLKAANDRIAQSDKTIQEQNTKIANLNSQIESLKHQIDPNQPKIVNSPKVIDWNVATYKWWDYAKQTWIPVPIGQTPSGTPTGNSATGNFFPVTNPNIVTTTSGGSAGGNPIPQLQTQTDALTKGLTDTNTKVAQLEKGLAGLETKVNTPPAPTPAPTPTPAPAPNYQPQIDVLRQQMSDLSTRLLGIPLVNMPQINQRFNGIENGIVGIRNDLNSRIEPAVRRTERNTQPDRLINATSEGVCREAGGNGCLGGRLNNLDTMGRNNGDTLRNLTSLLFDGFNAASNTAQLNQLGNIQGQLTRIEAQNVETHTRLGGRILGGISGAIRNVVNNQGVQTWMNRLNTALLVHNALMLSTNLVQSMGYVVDTVLDIVGIRFKNAEGEEIDTNTLVGKTVYQFFEDAVGKTTAATVTNNWKKLQKIYQVGANLLWSVRAMFDSTKSALDTITENSGRVGNALRRWGVVGENAYPTMPERNNATTASQKAMQRVIDGLQTAQNVTSNLDDISSNVLEVQEGANEIKNQQQELKTEIENFRTQEDAKAAAAKAESSSPEINLSDLVKKEDSN